MTYILSIALFTMLNTNYAFKISFESYHAERGNSRYMEFGVNSGTNSEWNGVVCWV